MNLTPVILCGGSGTRLWPLSRTHYPKQFLRLIDDHSLLQNTLLRLEGLPGLGRAIAVANEHHRFLLAEQLQDIGLEADILLEPAARNTAPAVAAAAHWSLRSGEAVLLVLPSDHVIADVAAFHRAVMAGLPHARAGKLVTFGIVPTRPETGYGYIRRGEPVEGGFAIDRFVEKPDAATAEIYLAAGSYFWNSGMFLFRADSYLAALERGNPAMAEAARKSVELARTDLDFIRLDKESFAAGPADSIDYAVMEQTTDGIVIPLDAGWNDIGAWDALAQSHPANNVDGAGNLLRGDVLASDTRNSTLFSESRFIAAIGIDDLVVVETQDAVLVAHKTKAQNVKQIVDHLKTQSREEADFHRRVHRPWGSYEGLAQGDRYQVKRIIVKPGASLSLQLHHHRAEHWVVVRGTARITRGEETLTLAENQSTYIPLGEKHRLENPGKIALELIEIQSGAYLGEDDIVRFEDHYGR
ncbi:MAG: mannose-1-phosphate guanylyltransferase/mannose-6-phosphate isomerase [Rhodocyclaceae bacterium]|nr:mannose-1-phosphate guanylyltransferase/mannose-6-phosphate isomerase [Rhodocyclaceae bacterium]